MTERIVLTHVYQIREAFDGSIQPTKRGLMQVCAIWELARQERIDGVLVAGGKVWGEQYPVFSEVLARQMRQIGVDIPIFIFSDAMDTPQEINTYLKEAKKREWKKLVFVGNETHLERIKNRVKARGIKEANFISSEEVLTQMPYFHQFVEEFKQSQIEANFKRREARVRLAYKLGLEKTLTLVARMGRKRPFKVNFDE